MLLLLLIWVRIVSFSGRYISLLFAVSSAYIDPTILPLFIFFLYSFRVYILCLMDGFDSRFHEKKEKVLLIIRI